MCVGQLLLLLSFRASLRGGRRLCDAYLHAELQRQDLWRGRMRRIVRNLLGRLYVLEQPDLRHN